MKKWHILVLSFIFNLTVWAQTYLINPEHSQIKFSINYMKITEVEGVFPKYDIYFELDNNGNIQSLTGKILINEINTNDKKRDSHLKRADFFHVEKYPFIEVNLNEKSKAINIMTAKEIYLDITIKEKTKSIKFAFEYLGKRPDPWTNVEGLYFNLKGQLNRMDFDITWNKKLEGETGFLIGDQVNLFASIESYHSNEKPAFSRFYKEKKQINSEPQTAEIIIKKNENTVNSPTETFKVAANNEMPTQISQDKIEYASFTNIAVTLVSGFIVFIILIILGIFGQKKLLDYLETKNFSATTNFVIASGLVMIILIIVSIYIAPFMGHGINPLTKYFN